MSTGEVVAIGTSDISNLGHVMDVSARFAGAIVSFLLVSVILLQTSLTLGLVVLIGVPLLMLMIGPLLGTAAAPHAPTSAISADSWPTPRATSSAACGCCAGSAASRSSPTATVVSRKSSAGPASRSLACSRCSTRMQILLPGVFVVFVVWIGARYAVAGQISPGELVAFYGYSAFLMIPLRTATEFANNYIRARVSAERVCHVLSLTPDVTDPGGRGRVAGGVRRTRRRPLGPAGAAGRILAIVTERTDEAAAPGRPAGAVRRRDRRRRDAWAAYP